MSAPQSAVVTTAASRPASFFIPRAALEALLDANATAYEICAYLVLARFTDASGRYSTASLAAINRYTNANKVRGGPVDKAINRLLMIRATRAKQVSNGKSGKQHAWIEQREDLGPILVNRETWLTQGGEPLPDGPSDRSKVRYVLPDFGELVDEQIWFGANLVDGYQSFKLPLRTVKHAGNVAARLLLALYAANDMDMWGGVRPVGARHGPWQRYETADKNEIHGHAWLIRAKRSGPVAGIDRRISGGDEKAYWHALEALVSSGLIYEVVMVLNRDPVEARFAISGEKYGAIPDDAEPYYELDTRSKHGYKPAGEEGIGGATARTAGELGYPVTEAGSVDWDREGNYAGYTSSARFNGTYAAIVPAGYQVMIAGIYRLRSRVANPKNAGVKGAWARIRENNRIAFELVQAVRTANGLQPLTAPWHRNEPTDTSANTEPKATA